MRVLIACEYSGKVRDEFIKRGHDAMSCDLLDTEAPGPHYVGDVRGVLDDGWDMLIGFPPCTHLAVSGSRHFKAKQEDGRQQEAIDFFMLLANCSIPRKCLENPIGIMSSVYRVPDQIVQPWWFGDPVPKSTCLWLTNLPPLSATNVVEPEYLIYKSSKTISGTSKYSIFGKLGKGKGHERSETFLGLAQAMASRWSGNLPPVTRQAAQLSFFGTIN